MPSTLERRNAADTSNAVDVEAHDGRRSVAPSAHPEGHAAFMARNPHLRRLATARELGDRCATEVAAEMLGAWLPPAKAVRLAAAVNSARTPWRIAAAVTDAELSFVSVASLRRFGVNRPASVLRRLRLATTALARSGAPGVWRVRRVEFRDTPEPVVLSTLHESSTSGVSLSLSALAVKAQWVKRPTPIAVNVPPVEPLPDDAERLSQHVTRWHAVTPFWLAHSQPVFAPATEIAYLAARPDHVSGWMNDVCDTLEDLCDRTPPDDLCAELEGHPLAAWVRAVCLAAGGDKLSLAHSLMGACERWSGDATLTPIEARRNETLLAVALVWRSYELKEFLKKVLAPATNPGVDMRGVVRHLSEVLAGAAVWRGEDMLRFVADQGSAGLPEYEDDELVVLDLLLDGHEHLALASTANAVAHRQMLARSRGASHEVSIQHAA